VALNAGLYWPRRSFLIRPGTVVIEFLPMIAPGLPPRAFFEKMQSEIETASDRLIAEAVAKEPGLAAVVDDGRAKAIARDREKKAKAGGETA
jgi:1-acyl-sn-glycerol-3-phosphate acyltransferase